MRRNSVLEEPGTLAASKDCASSEDSRVWNHLKLVVSLQT